MENLLENGLKLLGVIALVLLNGFFVAAEFAFIRLRDTQLEPHIIKGHRRARIARRIVRNVEACVSATQLGITLCGLATGALVKPVFKALLAPVFSGLGVASATTRSTVEFIVGFLVSTILLIVIGELVPKALAIRRTLSTSLLVAQPLEWFYRLTFPFIWALNHLAQWFLLQLGIQPLSEFHQTHSDEELRLLLGSGRHSAGKAGLGRNIVLNALDLKRRIVRDVMRPRQEIAFLSTGQSISECLGTAERTRYSRFPLCEADDLDRTLGVVHIKDLYTQRMKVRTGRELLAVCRGLIYVPETARLEGLLNLLLQRRLHLAIVVDEYGSTVGMVTLENILEELVGSIQDEFDQEKPLITRSGDDTWLVDGTLPLHHLAELVGEPLSAEGTATVGGFVIQRLGGFPKVGDELSLGAHQLRVTQVEGLRVGQLQLRKNAPTPADASNAGGI